MASDNKFPFTASRLASIPLPEKPGDRTVCLDERTPGLEIRITSTGVRSFYWRRRTPDGVKRQHLGKWPEVPIEEARRRAALMNGVLAEGENPVHVIQNQPKDMTFADLFGVYLERWAKQRKKTWKDDDSKFRLHLQPLHDKQLSQITRRDVANIHSQVGKDHPAFANRVLALVSKVFNVAVEFGLWEGVNPAKGIRHFPETSRDRFLDANELLRLQEALDKEPSVVMRRFFQVALLTGARRNNVCAMRFDEIDFDRAVWRIPKTKNKDPLTVPLVDTVLEILREMRDGNQGEWVFPSPRSATGHMVEPRKAWLRILAVAGIDHARIHDLRRTMGSWQAITGASLQVIGKGLGHKTQDATAIYARLTLDPVRAAMEKAAEAMLKKP
ncbi:MAG: tyrosine-type recombinase/integrase [Magnetococcales bacterium]|nr:tyrosine-type recombinase/integrase [Magnetococcales bacterium]